MEYTTTHLAGVFDLSPSTQTSGTAEPAEWFVKALEGGATSDADVRVTEQTMLTSGPIWEAINLISGDVGMLPINVFKREGVEPNEQKVKIRDHRGSKLMRREPHKEIRPMQFRERLTADALTWGNGIAFIKRKVRSPMYMTPVDPSRTTLKRMPDKSLQYVTYDDNGTEWWAPPDDVLHIVGFGTGVWGYNVFENARNSWGLHLTLQKHGNKQFSKGSVPSGVISSDVKMSKDGREGVRREWNDVHQGSDNSGEVAVLTRGLTYQAITIPNRDAEWLGSLRFSREDVACWFLLPAHKLNSMENSSVRANIEERNREYLQQCLSHWLTRWEQELDRKLLSETQWLSESHFFKFNPGGLLKGDISSTLEGIRTGIESRVLTINDGRRLLDMNPIGPEGDKHENPNTTSSEDSGAGDRDDTEDDDNSGNDDGTPLQNRGREVSAVVQLATEALGKINNLEKRELMKAAKHHPEQFEQQAAKFYQRSTDYICDCFGNVIRAGKILGVTPDALSPEAITYAYTEESYERILCAAAKSGEIEDAVKSELQLWPNRHESMISTICG